MRTVLGTVFFFYQLKIHFYFNFVIKIFECAKIFVMVRKLSKVVRSRLFLDIVGLITPIFTAVFAAIPLFFAENIAHFIQVFIVAYFLSIFLIRLVAFIRRLRAREFEDERLVNITYGKIMLSSAIAIFIEISGIYIAFMFIIWSQSNKGLFASSIYFALAYVAMFLVRLIINLIQILTKRHHFDYYQKTLLFISTISLLYVMVVSLNYLMYSLELRNRIFETIFASLSVSIMIFICFVMVFESITYIRKNKRFIRKEYRELKRNTRLVYKDVRKKERMARKAQKDIERLDKKAGRKTKKKGKEKEDV